MLQLLAFLALAFLTFFTAFFLHPKWIFGQPQPAESVEVAPTIRPKPIKRVKTTFFMVFPYIDLQRHEPVSMPFGLERAVLFHLKCPFCRFGMTYYNGRYLIFS
jgi:hypothetical protein